jgi:hypothetical protein
MNTAQTVITAELLKPDKASSGVTSLVNARLPKTSNAIRSTRKLSVMSKTTAIRRMLRVNIISRVTKYSAK